jgi:hypothetical protein
MDFSDFVRHEESLGSLSHEQLLPPIVGDWRWHGNRGEPEAQRKQQRRQALGEQQKRMS